MLRELKLRGTLAAVADSLGYTPSAVSQQLAQLQRDIGVPVDVLDEEFHRVLQALVLQEIDVVLTDEYSHLPRPRRPELTSEVLVTEIMRVGMPEGHPLAGPGGPVRMADLAGCPWVTGHVGTNHADLLERTCVELGGFRPDVRYRNAGQCSGLQAGGESPAGRAAKARAVP
ncbi:hypothetical protein GCM10010402_48300 [Actinomadura luteofluorescens]|nr:LysR substrate binding domain-containing protein [Actinomadura glauciflava]